MKTYNTKLNQNIFDVAVQLYGSIEGVFYLMAYNDNISFDTVFAEGDEVNYDESGTLNEDVINYLSNNSVYIANSERHVYYKECDEYEVANIIMPSSEESAVLKISGDGFILIDWGDNTPIETITLSSVVSEHLHYFDNLIDDDRNIRIYGEKFGIKVWDMTPTKGNLYLLDRIFVDEFICNGMNTIIDSFRLFSGTYNISLSNMHLNDLMPIRDLSLSSLTLSNNYYYKSGAIDDYLKYIAYNNNSRRDCRVIINGDVSGEYKEPAKNSSGTYIINTGMEAIYVITHEQSWNSAGAWEFNINNNIYKYENKNVA